MWEPLRDKVLDKLSTSFWQEQFSKYHAEVSVVFTVDLNTDLKLSFIYGDFLILLRSNTMPGALVALQKIIEEKFADLESGPAFWIGTLDALTSLSESDRNFIREKSIVVFNAEQLSVRASP